MRIKIIFSLGLYFGWLLAFAFNGPILAYFVQQRGYTGYSLGLLFTMSHGITLLLFGFIMKKSTNWKRLMILSGEVCLLAILTMHFLDMALWPFLIVLMGISSSVFVLGWSFPYSFFIEEKSRISVMAQTIILANLVLFVSVILSVSLPSDFSFVIYVFTACPLLLSIIISSKFICDENIRHNCFEAGNAVAKGLYKLLIFLGILVFGLYINGGLMYTVINQTLVKYSISFYYKLLPYILILVIMSFCGSKIKGMLPVYIGTALLGLSFISFALFSDSIIGYYIIETLMQAAWAFLDLFVWVIVGSLSRFSRNNYKVFGVIIFVNVFAIFIGGSVGGIFFGLGEQSRIFTALLAAAAIFINLLFKPFLSDSLNEYLNACAPKEKMQICTIENYKGYKDSIPNIETLTAREREIVDLLFSGCTNKDIAIRLCISENTIKTHVRHIYRKLNVSSKNELLSIVIDSYNGIKSN